LARVLLKDPELRRAARHDARLLLRAAASSGGRLMCSNQSISATYTSLALNCVPGFVG
jgi:hypothetical protein